jgi:hypothetical protein
LLPGATLGAAGRSGSGGSRVNEFFDMKAFVTAPFIPDGGLLMANIRFPVAGRYSAVSEGIS